MERLADLPKDMIFFTQITMEAAEDTKFLDAMRKAHIKGALVGVEAVTEEGLKAVLQGFQLYRRQPDRASADFPQSTAFTCWARFIFGLPTDRPDTFMATCDLAEKAGVTFAQFVMLTPFAGTVDFERWEKDLGDNPATVDGVPLTRYWLIPRRSGRKCSCRIRHEFGRHAPADASCLGPLLQSADILEARRLHSESEGTLAFMFISISYIAKCTRAPASPPTARESAGQSMARVLAKPCRRLFQAKPMPELRAPDFRSAVPPGRSCLGA